MVRKKLQMKQMKGKKRIMSRRGKFGIAYIHKSFSHGIR
jgi:hypothetical protein